MSLFLSEADVARLAHVDVALAAVRAAHVALSQGHAIDQPRLRVRTPGATLHSMQAAWPERGVIGYKAYTSSREGARFWVHLFDCNTGAPIAVLEADLLGMLRTGAVSALASSVLARADASRLLLFGTGWQAQGQLRAHALAMPQLDSFYVFARDTVKLRAFCEKMSAELGKNVLPTDKIEQVLGIADIVITATSSPKPLFDGGLLPKGSHVGAVGSNSLIRREIDEKTVTQADVICVDSVPTALAESGDLLPALEKGQLHQRQLRELGDVLCGRQPGRIEAGQRTLFESQGLAIQDLALAVELVERAKAAGIGQTMPY
ncbi:ornithine cyclodeaminase family protein [Uliginosibacterium gangwonense]|uniref:ornithine cyclodeaminase family protein n=1 Tax=Uliginosibacterium gangwonense TaxID=392736 RepID=UPI000366C73F|nr:ornithine cyclodeaminase family protein [Uliginosibacterium gangwonense]